MMAVEVAENKAVSELVAFLSGGQKPLDSIPEKLRSLAVLHEALEAGKIEFGRPGHISLPTGERHGKEKNYAIKMRVQVEGGPGDWSWTDLSQPWSKTLAELLEEEATIDKAIKLHVRLVGRRR